MRILLVEDKISEAKRIKAALEALGHAVIHITGAKAIGDGTISSLDNQTIEPKNFDVAFVDAGLEGNYHGWDLTPVLVHGGVVCVAISSGGQFNLLVEKAGAQLGLAKEQVVTDLQQGHLQLEWIVTKYGRQAKPTP
jgi:hypothetical protein